MAYCGYCGTTPFVTRCPSYYEHVECCRKAYTNGSTTITIIINPNEISARIERDLWSLPCERIDTHKKINDLMDRIIEVVPELAKAYDNKTHYRHKEAVQYVVRLLTIMQKILHKNKELAEDIRETCEELLGTI